MKSLMMSTALVLALAAGSAWAQANSEPPPAPSIPSIPDPGQGLSGGPSQAPSGANQGSPAASEGTFNAPGSQQMMASDLIGTTVRNDQGEPVGEVEDILLSQNGQVDGLVLSVGDFLGIGGKNVGVRMDKLKFGTVSGPEPEVVLMMSKDELSKAEEYGGGSEPPSPGNSDDSLTRGGSTGASPIQSR